MSLLKKILRESLSEYNNNNVTTLFHYSNVDSDTITLTPDKFGQNYYTKNDVRASSKKRIFFYLNPSQKERFFYNSNLYSVQVPTSQIYDVLTDPLNIKKSIREKNNGILNFDLLFDYILDKGYKGIYYRPADRDVVIWFYNIKVYKVKN